MSDAEAGERASELVFTFAIPAPPETVRRAIETPELRALWLPGCLPTDAAALPPTKDGELRFTMRDGDLPAVETTVTFRVEPGAEGGTVLRIVHAIPHPRTHGSRAANDDRRTLMRAA